MKDQLSPAGYGINVLCQAFKANPLFLKVGHRGNQMRQGSAQAVKPPDNKGIAFADIAEGFVQSFPLRLRATGGISEDFTACSFFECVLLQMKRLFRG